MVCSEDKVETFQHLFIDCEVASFLWEGLLPVFDVLRFNFGGTPRSVLLGDVSGFDTSNLATADWPERTPSEDTLINWVRLLWTEIRGATLKAIWDARCARLHHNRLVDNVQSTKGYAFHKMLGSLRSLVLMKTPSQYRSIHVAQQEGEDLANFYKLTWGKIAPMILSIAPLVPLPPGMNENLI